MFKHLLRLSALLLLAALAVFLAAVFLALIGLMFPTTSSGRESSMFRIAYIEPSPWGGLCIADASTEARGCIMEPGEGVDFRDLAWSPDGTMIAVQQELFRNGENIGGQLVVVAADGGDKLPGGGPSPSVLSGNERVHGRPMWSSDSEEVAILAGEEGILIMSTADGSRRFVSLEALGGLLALPSDIAWSPDNEHFAIGALNASDRPALILLDAKDGSAETLVEFTGNDIGFGGFNDISWSADGTQILFTRALPPPSAPWGGTRSQHWIVNADGTNPKMLYDSGQDDVAVLEAQFSPFGDTIAFDGMSGDVINIFLMRSDGSNIRQLTHSATGAFGPRWWPGADTHILYWDTETATMNLVTTDIGGSDGGLVRTLFPGMNYEWAPLAGPLPPGLSTPEPTSTVIPTPAPTLMPPAVPDMPNVAAPATGAGGATSSGSGFVVLAVALAVAGAFAASGSMILANRRARIRRRRPPAAG